MAALGPLRTIFDDALVDSIIADGKGEMIIRRGSKVTTETTPFPAAQQNGLARRLARAVEQPLSGERKRVSAYLGDGLNLEILSEKAAQPGPIIMIRRIPTLPIDLNDLVRTGAIALRVVELLHHCVKASCSVLVVGPRHGVRSQILAGIASVWREDGRVIALNRPFVAAADCEDVIQIEGPEALDTLVAGFGEVIAVDEPASGAWGPLLLAEESLLASLASTSMSLGIRRLLAQITYERPGMVMTGVEALITSTIDLIVHCDEARVLGLGEIQHWGSQLAVRALGKWRDDQFLLDLRESALLARLGESAENLKVDGLDVIDDGLAGCVGTPLGIAPVTTGQNQRQVSQSFALDQKERSEDGLVNNGEAPTANGISEVMPEAAESQERTRAESPGDNGEVLYDANNFVEAIEEAKAEEDNSSPESEEDLQYEEDMPSVAYQLALPEDDEQELGLEPDDASPFDDATPALELDDSGELAPNEALVLDSQATMIISQEEVDVFKPSGDDVQAGTGRQGTRPDPGAERPRRTGRPK